MPADACIGRVSLKRARELLAARSDRVEQSTLSRYVAKYADALDPQRDGRETTIDFETLALHRSQNVNRGEGASPAPAVSVPRGRADEAALNIRAQRQIRELEIAERIGALTPTREVNAAAAESIGAMRNALALSENDSALVIANVCGVEPRVVRPHLKAFGRKALEAFVRTLTERGFGGEAPAA